MVRIFFSFFIMLGVLNPSFAQDRIEIERKRTDIEHKRDTQVDVRERKVYLDTDVPTKNPYQKVQNEDQQKVINYEKALRARVDVDFKDVTIREAMNSLAKQMDANFLLAWSAWEKRLGIDPAAKVSLTLKQVPAERIIMMLMSLATDHEMILEVQPWFIEIKPQRWADKQTVTKTYFLYDIKFAPEDYSKKPLIVTESNITSQGQTVRRDREVGIEVDEDEGVDVDLKLQDRKVTSRSNTSGFVVRQDIDYKSPKERAAGLAEVIRQTVAPKTWRKNGGDKNSIMTFDDKIIINAPLYVHRKIAHPISIFRDKNKN